MKALERLRMVRFLKERVRAHVIRGLETSQVGHRKGWDFDIDASNATAGVRANIGDGMNGVEKVVECVLL